MLFNYINVNFNKNFYIKNFISIQYNIQKLYLKYLHYLLYKKIKNIFVNNIKNKYKINLFIGNNK